MRRVKESAVSWGCAGLCTAVQCERSRRARFYLFCHSVVMGLWRVLQSLWSSVCSTILQLGVMVSSWDDTWPWGLTWDSEWEGLPDGEILYLKIWVREDGAQGGKLCPVAINFLWNEASWLFVNESTWLWGGGLSKAEKLWGRQP